MSLFDTSIYCLLYKRLLYIVHTHKEGKITKDYIKIIGKEAAGEQSISESTLFIKRDLVYSKIKESYFT